MKWLKIMGVVFGATVVTALGIDAADTLSGSEGTMLAQLIGGAGDSGACPAGMIEIPAATTFTCVDEYEASPNTACPVEVVSNEFDTQKNLEAVTCGASSRAEQKPWVYVSREDAQLACVRSGKRLPNNQEWQLIAAGTPDDTSLCNLDASGTRLSGQGERCRSAVGVFDAVGNVWEWTQEDVIDGVYNGRTLPKEGYVVQVDTGGIATVSGTSSTAAMGEDYFWSKKKGAYAIMRGGYHGSESDGGVYATHAATAPTMKGEAIGFRCVQ